jgi:polyphosphate kinase
MAELAIDQPPPEAKTAAAPLSPSQRYINRELSWLAFNERVLEEASNSGHPLLERVRFLSISDSNLDEFYMVRVAALKELAASGVPVKSEDGLTPEQQLAAIAEVAAGLVQICRRGSAPKAFPSPTMKR